MIQLKKKANKLHWHQYFFSERADLAGIRTHKSAIYLYKLNFSL